MLGSSARKVWGLRSHCPGHSESKCVELDLPVTFEPDGHAEEFGLIVPSVPGYWAQALQELVEQSGVACARKFKGDRLGQKVAE